jgi:hypothetical protein
MKSDGERGRLYGVYGPGETSVSRLFHVVRGERRSRRSLRGELAGSLAPVRLSEACTNTGHHLDARIRVSTESPLETPFSRKALSQRQPTRHRKPEDAHIHLFSPR